MRPDHLLYNYNFRQCFVKSSRLAAQDMIKPHSIWQNLQNNPAGFGFGGQGRGKEGNLGGRAVQIVENLR
jgi:hypothetical protein